MNPFYQTTPQVMSPSPTEHLKKYLQKPLIMTIGVLSIFQMLISATFSILLSYLSTSPLYSSYTTQAAAAQNAVIQYASIAITVIFSLLYSFSYVIMYSQAKKGKSPTGAVTALQVLSVISLVFYIILLILFTLAVVIIFAGIGFASTSLFRTYGDAVYNISMSIVLVLVSVIEVILIALLFYPIALVRLSFSVKGILTGRSDTVKGASAVGVYNVIFCVFACIATLIILIGFLATLTEGRNIISISINGRSLTGTDAILMLGIMLIMLVFSVVTFIIKARAAFGLKRHMNTFAAFGNIGSGYNNPNQYGTNQQNYNQYGDQYNNPVGGYPQNNEHQSNPTDNNPYGGNY